MYIYNAIYIEAFQMVSLHPDLSYQDFNVEITTEISEVKSSMATESRHW